MSVLKKLISNEKTITLKRRLLTKKTNSMPPICFLTFNENILAETDKSLENSGSS